MIGKSGKGVKSSKPGEQQEPIISISMDYVDLK